MVEFYLNEKKRDKKVTLMKLYNALSRTKPSRIGCSKRTFERTIEKYLKTGNLPSSTDDGITLGRPFYLKDENIHILNENIKETPGLTQDLSDI